MIRLGCIGCGLLLLAAACFAVAIFAEGRPWASGLGLIFTVCGAVLLMAASVEANPKI